MAINAEAPVLQIQLDVVQQELEYNGLPKVIPQTYWTDTLSPLLYPTWDSDKDKLILFSWYTNGTYVAKRRKYVKDFKTNTFKWVDYEMEQVGVAEATALKDKLIEGFYLIDSLENDDFQNELARLYLKTKTVTPLNVRIARDFLLDETDWTQVPDSSVSADDKVLYTTYRTKLRELTDQPEFASDTQNTKFPISPLFYTKIWKTENPGIDYLSTDEQFLPLAGHYLRFFKDKIANYLMLKQATEKGLFATFIAEYEYVKANKEARDYNTKIIEDTELANPTQTSDYLNALLRVAQKELDNLES